MPHCIIEYAKPLEKVISSSALMQAVYHGALKSELFEPTDIKLRTVPYVEFASGENQNALFVHVCLKILSGRTLEQRTMLSQAVLSELNGLESDFSSETSLTVEVYEIEKASYAKRVL